MTGLYRCWAEVDLSALHGNLNEIRLLAGPEKKIMAVVKADAYGHGLKQIAAVLMQAGSDVFGVATLAEARAVRSIGKGWPILLLGACLPFEVESVVREGVMATVSSVEEAHLFSNAAVRLQRSVFVQVKIDTGMGRLGGPPEAGEALLEEIGRLPGLLVTGLFTHYSSVEDDPDFTLRQRVAFSGLVNRLKSKGASFEWLHASNSGGLLLENDSDCNTVRPGLLVYGIAPKGYRELDARKIARFRPALTWKCRIGFLKTVPPGTAVSYGHTYFTKVTKRLATITAGYGDGYLRAASNRASVLIGGRRCAILGRVTMDQMIADVSDAGPVQIGDEVVLIGNQGQETITATQLADWCDTIPWEVLTNITYRVPRIYRGGNAA